MNVQNISSTYDAWSALYDETPNPLIAVEESVVRSLLRTMEFDQVLDAATGTGRYAIHLARAGETSICHGCQQENALDCARQSPGSATHCGFLSGGYFQPFLRGLHRLIW